MRNFYESDVDVVCPKCENIISAKLRAILNAKDSLADDSTLTSKSYKFRRKYYIIRREVPPNPLIRAIH